MHMPLLKCKSQNLYRGKTWLLGNAEIMCKTIGIGRNPIKMNWSDKNIDAFLQTVGKLYDWMLVWTDEMLVLTVYLKELSVVISIIFFYFLLRLDHCSGRSLIQQSEAISKRIHSWNTNPYNQLFSEGTNNAKRWWVYIKDSIVNVSFYKMNTQ